MPVRVKPSRVPTRIKPLGGEWVSATYEPNNEAVERKELNNEWHYRAGQLAHTVNKESALVTGVAKAQRQRYTG
jgi:hypothetical protein